MVVGVAESLGVTPAQVILRRHVQLGAVAIPKSADADRQRTNLDVFGFQLRDTQMTALSERAHQRLGGDPDSHEEF